MPDELPPHVLISSFSKAVAPGLAAGEQVVCGM
jgi:hypothetical protein